MGHKTIADISASISMLSAWISVSSIQPFVSSLASLIGICTGLFAIRYYYYATKEIKKSDNS
jgi:hypothetical protein